MAQEGVKAASPRRTGDTIQIPGDYQYNALNNGFVVQRFWHRLKFSVIERIALPDESMSVLDVGCGSGVVSDFLAQHAQCVHAADGNPLAIEFASQRFRRENLHFHLCLVDELTFGEGEFDLIYCLELLEHFYWEQAIEFVGSLARLLKPSGRLFVTTPNYHSLWPLIEKTLDAFHLVPQIAEHQHVSKPTRRKLRELAEQCNLRVIAEGRCVGLAPFTSIFGWRLAEFIDRQETRLNSPFGNLLYALWGHR